MEPSEPKILTLVVGYNRPDNLKTWLRVWGLLKPRPLPLIVVENSDGLGGTRFVSRDSRANAMRFMRPNVGFACGVMQDIVLGRFDRWLAGLEWNWLFVAPDDFLPMVPDFQQPYRSLASCPDLNLGLIGCRDSEVGGNYHMRTGGYMIRRDVASRLRWPADPITDIQQTYDLESGSFHMMNQVRDEMGLGAVILADPENRVMWDSGHEADQNRWAEIPG